MGKDINELIKRSLDRSISDRDLKNIQKEVIEKQDPYCICQYGYQGRIYNLSELEDALIKIGDVRFMCIFASRIPNANVDKFLDALIQDGDLKNILLYSDNVRGVNKEKVEDKFLASDDIFFITEYATRHDLKDVTSFATKLLVNNDPEVLLSFLTKHYSKLGLELLKQYIERIVSLDTTGKLTRNIVDSIGFVDMVTDSVIVHDNARAMVKILRSDKISRDKSTFDALEDALALSNNPFAICTHVYINPKANIKKMQKAIINHGGASFLFLFAYNVQHYQMDYEDRGLDVKQLQKAILQTGNLTYIRSFASNIKGVDALAIDKAIAMMENNNSRVYVS